MLFLWIITPVFNDRPSTSILLEKQTRSKCHTCISQVSNSDHQASPRSCRRPEIKLGCPVYGWGPGSERSCCQARASLQHGSGKDQGYGLSLSTASKLRGHQAPSSSSSCLSSLDQGCPAVPHQHWPWAQAAQPCKEGFRDCPDISFPREYLEEPRTEATEP